MVVSSSRHRAGFGLSGVPIFCAQPHDTGSTPCHSGLRDFVPVLSPDAQLTAADIAVQSSYRGCADLSSGICPFSPLFGVQKGARPSGRNQSAIRYPHGRDLQPTPFTPAVNTPALGPHCKQSGFALPGEPIFFVRPKKTGEKKRRPITWPAGSRAFPCLCSAETRSRRRISGSAV